MQRHAAEQSNLFSHRRSRGPPRVSFGVLSVGRAATHVVQMWLLPMAPPLPSAPCDQAHAAISETRRFGHGRDILSGRGNCCFRNNPAPERANPTSAAAPSRERGSGIFACHLAGLLGGWVLSITKLPGIVNNQFAIRSMNPNSKPMWSPYNRQ